MKLNFKAMRTNEGFKTKEDIKRKVNALPENKSGISRELVFLPQ